MIITADKCKELATQYKTLLLDPNISEARAFLLKNIAKSLMGLAGQLDRLAKLIRDDEESKRRAASP